MKKTLALFAVAFLTPFVAFAQNAEGLLDDFGGLVESATPIVFSLALLFFFWGLATFILKSGDDKELGKQRMIWGLVALFVMFSVWGILRFAQESLGINSNEQGLSVPKLGK